MNHGKLGILFLILAALAGCVAAVPRWRARCCWGRSHPTVPMSSIGLGSWSAACALIAAVALGLLPPPWLLIVVPLVAAAGCYDTFRFRRRER